VGCRWVQAKARCSKTPLMEVGIATIVMTGTMGAWLASGSKRHSPTDNKPASCRHARGGG
jgi:hypothetical protein